MNKIRIFLSLILILAALPQKTEALLDIFTVYGKRNNQIKSIICETLSNFKTKWIRVRSPITENDGFSTWSVYRKEQDENANNPELELYFSEFHYGKHPTIQTLNQIFETEKKLAKLEIGKKCTDNRGNMSIYRVHINFDLIDQNENNLLYDQAFFSSEQKMKYVDKKPLFGPATEEIISEEPEVIEKTPSTYQLIWVIDLGNREFREYRFVVSRKVPTPEERSYMIQIFQKIETRIRNVQS
jgi:hypothetical protein